MKINKYILTILAFFIIMIEPVTVIAARNDIMSEIDDTQKNLTIHFYVQNNGVDTPISGASIGIYKIADLNCKNGSANYNLLPQYSAVKKTDNDRDCTFDGLSGTAAEKLSKQISDLVTLPYATGITDKYGNITFENLPQGMYLVKEIKTEGDASNYILFAPYLISVPLAVQDENGNYWKYDVFSEPKTKVKIKDTNTNTTTSIPTSSETSTPSNTTSSEITSSSNSENSRSVINNDGDRVKTGDVTNLTVFLVITFGMVFLVTVLITKKRGED